MSELRRWNDDRLDDLAGLARATNELVTRNTSRIEKHDEALSRIFQSGDRRSERRWDFSLALAVVILSAVANIAVTILHSA